MTTDILALFDTEAGIYFGTNHATLANDYPTRSVRLEKSEDSGN